MATVCVVLEVVVARGWHLHQMGVKNAFPEDDLEDEQVGSVPNSRSHFTVS